MKLWKPVESDAVLPTLVTAAISRKLLSQCSDVGMDPQIRYTLRRDIASIMKDLM